FYVFGTGWCSGDPDGELVLYHLLEVIQADKILFLEGEKIVNLVRDLGLTATTAAHGAKSPQRTDYSPLAGKKVIRVPDNDKDGESYIATAIDMLAKLDPAPTVKILRLPLEKKRDDIEQWLQSLPAGWGPDERREELERFVDEAEPIDLSSIAPA